ncbi:MAG: hypothetical protein M1825_001612 [Sarcosagium campestre]|nr:MAG: hypothetical protein M1825_001612 [Sarcosagium campestre]
MYRTIPRTALRHLARPIPIRRTFTSGALRASQPLAAPPRPPPFQTAPSPPRLPQHEQEIFEDLQRSSTGAFSTPRPRPTMNQSPHSAPLAASEQEPEPRREVGLAQDAERERIARMSGKATGTAEQDETEVDAVLVNARVRATGKGEELHPDVRRGALPEFEGEVNPKTGEVGGPKNEPLRWGDSGDWSYNGRVTDF